MNAEYCIVYAFASCDEDNLGTLEYLVGTKKITEDVLGKNGLVLSKYGYDINKHHWFLGIKESCDYGYMGQIHFFPQGFDKINPDWHRRLKEFCKEFKIRFRKPVWIVTMVDD